MNKSALGIGLQLTGLATCPFALAWGFAGNGPAEWALLGLAAVLFFMGHSLREGSGDAAA